MNPNARWPMKAEGRAAPGVPPGEVPAEVGSASLPDVAAPGRRGAVPELVTRIKRLQQLQSADGANGVIDVGGDPPVYIIFLVVPEEPPCRATEALTRAPEGVRLDDSSPIGVDVPSRASRQDNPSRHRQSAALPTV
jgi:hypothetical protein